MPACSAPASWRQALARARRGSSAVGTGRAGPCPPPRRPGSAPSHHAIIVSIIIIVIVIIIAVISRCYYHYSFHPREPAPPPTLMTNINNTPQHLPGVPARRSVRGPSVRLTTIVIIIINVQMRARGFDAPSETHGGDRGNREEFDDDDDVHK